MLDASVVREVVQLGGTVFTVVVFVWYLSRRDIEMQKTLGELRDVVHELSGRLKGKTHD